MCASAPSPLVRLAQADTPRLAAQVDPALAEQLAAAGGGGPNGMPTQQVRRTVYRPMNVHVTRQEEVSRAGSMPGHEHSTQPATMLLAAFDVLRLRRSTLANHVRRTLPRPRPERRSRSRLAGTC
jgi:hypothetical protein